MTSVRIASFLGLPVGPIALSTAPVPLRTPHARHELHPLETDRISGGFRPKLASSFRLRGFTHFIPLATPPLARRQLQTEATICNAMVRTFVAIFMHDGRVTTSINRRDQRTVLLRSTGCWFGPFPLSTAPVPLRKPCARHEQASAMCRKSGGLPSAARRRPLRFGFIPLCAPFQPALHFPRSPTADRSA